MECAQGERLQTFGKRPARVECEGLNNDLVVIEDDFIVASVQRFHWADYFTVDGA